MTHQVMEKRMKAVLRELAQARRHYSGLPLFEFLRSESIPARDRLAFYPCMAPFILASSDLNRFVLRDEASDDPHQKLLNERTYEDDHHWPWYLDDFAKLGFDRSASITQVLRSYMKDDARESRMLGARLAQLLQGATPVEKLVVVEAIEATGNVLFELTSKIAAQLEAAGGPELRYFGRFHFPREPGISLRGYDRSALETIALSSLERVRCLDLSFRVFDLFADWSAELLGYAKNSLAHRTVPHLVHSTAGAEERAAKRLS
ncbi:MAG: hypothetical protein ABI821_03150 [Pseudomonadota bacterium]